MSSKVSGTPSDFSTNGKARLLLSPSYPMPLITSFSGPLSGSSHLAAPRAHLCPTWGPPGTVGGRHGCTSGKGAAVELPVRCSAFLGKSGDFLFPINHLTRDYFYFFPLNKSPLLRSPIPTLFPQQHFQGGAEPDARSSLPWAPRHRAPPHSSRARTRRRRRRAAAGVPGARRQQRGSSPGRASPASALCGDGRAERGRGAAAGMRAQFRGSFFSFSPPPLFFRCPHPPPSPRNIQGSKIRGMEKMRRQQQLPDACRGAPSFPSLFANSHRSYPDFAR